MVSIIYSSFDFWKHIICYMLEFDTYLKVSRPRFRSIAEIIDHETKRVSRGSTAINGTIFRDCR